MKIPRISVIIFFLLWIACTICIVMGGFLMHRIQQKQARRQQARAQKAKTDADLASVGASKEAEKQAQDARVQQAVEAEKVRDRFGLGASAQSVLSEFGKPESEPSEYGVRTLRYWKESDQELPWFSEKLFRFRQDHLIYVRLRCGEHHE